MKGKKGFQKGKDNPAFGKKPHNFGKHPSEEQLRKQRESHKGYKMPQEQKEKIGKANKGKKKPPRTKEHRKKLGVKGENNHFWVDGRAKERYKYSEDWTHYLRESIRIRDNYICQECGIHQDELEFGRVKRLDIHHIDYVKDNIDCKNLISLCRGCHVKTNFNREYWIKHFKNYE